MSGYLSRVAMVFVAAGSMLALSACGPEDIDGQVKCTRDAAGAITCSYVPNTPPPITTEPPVTEPPVTEPPVTEPPVTEPPVTDPPETTDPVEPVDPNEGLPAAEVEATSLQGKARVDWSTDRTDITGWHVERDGTDTGGFGVWGTELPADARSFTFDLLRGGDKYTVTLTGKTASGSLAPVTSTVVPKGTPPVVEPTEPPVTEPTDPPVTDGTTAAEKLGWGTPLAAGSDEFNYTGKPDGTKWSVAGECWAGHDGNGKRCASRSNVADGMLTQTGLANGDSAWLASKLNQRYGKWEARVRSSEQGSNNGRQYHPLLIVWPQSDRWPGDGEYDFLENGRPGAECAESFIHYPHPNMPVQQEFERETNCGAPLSEWHNVAFEWTPDYVAGYIDGKQWFRYSDGANGSRSNIQDMPSGHLTIQLDNFYGAGMQPARYDIDWVRTYK